MTTSLTKPVKRRSNEKRNDRGKYRAIIVTIYPAGYIGVIRCRRNPGRVDLGGQPPRSTRPAERTGRYTVDQIASEPLPSGHTARRWGVLLKLDDGTIIEEPDPWDV